MSIVLYPTHGIIAGHAGATYEVKAFMAPALATYAADLPASLEFIIHVDDVAQDGCHENMAQLVVDFGKALRRMRFAFQGPDSSNIVK